MARRARSFVLAVALAVAIPAGALAAPGVDEAEARRDQLLAQASAAYDRLAEIEREFQLAAEELNGARIELDAANQRVAGVAEEYAGIQGEMDGHRDRAGDLARRLYTHGSVELAALDAVLASTSITDAELRMTYLRVATESTYAVVEQLEGDRFQVGRILDKLARERAAAAAVETRAADLQAQVEAQLDDQAGEVSVLRAAIGEAEAALGEAVRIEQEARERAAQEAAEAAAREAAAREAAEREVSEREVSDREVAEEVPIVRAPPSGEGGQVAVDAALSQLGKPYVYAADGPDSYDCSGLTMWAWAHAGVSLPHQSRMQYQMTARVSADDWQPGDLLFFGSPIHHVAMYIGDGQVVEAPYTGSQVRIKSAYRGDYVGAGRPGV